MFPTSIAEKALGEQELIEDLFRRIAELEDAIRQALPYLRSRSKAERNQGLELLESAIGIED